MVNFNPNLDRALQQGVQHHRAGRLAEAEALYRQILQQDPRNAHALHLLGVLAAHSQRYDMAVDLMGQAIALNPNSFEALSNLGNALRDAGRLEEAVAAHRQAVALNPNSAEALSNLGAALKDLGQFDEAIAVLRQSVARKPNLSEAHNNLGVSLRDQGQPEEAIAAFRQAAALKPEFSGAYYNLGLALRDQGRLEEAITAFREAIAFNPNFQVALSDLLLTLHLHPGYEPEAIAEEHRRWNREHGAPLKKFMQPHDNDRDPERRLRIGYVSPDYREHAVAPMVLPLVANHDHARFEVFCYAQVARPDAMTERFRGVADHWRNTVGWSDEWMAQEIRKDRIDILIDLAGHTVGNRLLVFARKPAPVQVARQGYPDTTGLETIDYRMTDAYADPPGLSDTLHSEKLIRLPQTNWIYQPPEEALDLAVEPLRPDAPITFGCFNNFAKVTEPMLRVWAEIVAAVPGAQILLKDRVLTTASVRERVRAIFAARGIGAERVEVSGRHATVREHLQAYNRVAIGLDPFPYHGTTTTCEALWMGVPVVTLAGRTHVSRVGVSLLNNVGLPELIAHSPEEYVQVAVRLAADRARLRELRPGLRARMAASPILDHVRFARHMEEAYRQMWRTWCARAG